MTWGDFAAAVTSKVASRRGNRWFVSDQAIAETPWLEQFMALFAASFERDELTMGWWFAPP